MSAPSVDEDEFAAALRAAIAARGLSLDRIRYHLARRGHELSVATISYWQSGRSRPERATSLAALAVLEELLELEPGHLSGKLATRRRSASTPAADPIEAPTMLPPQVETSLVGLGLSWDSGLARVAIHDRLTVGPERRLTTRLVRELLVAERDGVDRVPHVHRYMQPGAGITVRALQNCKVGVIDDIGLDNLIVVQMLMQRPLVKGEALIIEYELLYSGTSGVDKGADRGLANQVSSAHIEVVFHPKSMPLTAQRYTVVDGVHRSEPVVIAGNSVHGLVLDFGPGTHGIRWSWGPG